MQDWLDVLETVGVNSEAITLTTRIVPDDWGKGAFRGIVVDVNYLGLQLGDAVYWQEFPQTTREPVNISDCGFGLERILWALNGNSYFDSFGLGEKNIYLADALRTAVLMSTSGVSPYSDRVRQRSDRFRQLINNIRHERGNSQLENLIAGYFDFWTNYIRPDAPGSLENVRNYTIMKMRGLVEKGL